MKRQRTKLMAEINITPFTDVVLVLLIIFMVTTPLIMQSGIKVKLPQTSKVEVESDKNVMIMVNQFGEIFLHNRKYELEGLRNELLARFRVRPDLVVIIDGDKDVRYDHIIRVIDVAQESGAKRFALGTELKKAQSKKR